MNEVIQAVRKKYPEYKDVPDDDLTFAIGQKYPEYLGHSGFASDFNTVSKARQPQKLTPPTDAPQVNNVIFAGDTPSPMDIYDLTPISGSVATGSLTPVSPVPLPGTQRLDTSTEPFTFGGEAKTPDAEAVALHTENLRQRYQNALELDRYDIAKGVKDEATQWYADKGIITPEENKLLLFDVPKAGTKESLLGKIGAAAWNTAASTIEGVQDPTMAATAVVLGPMAPVAFTADLVYGTYQAGKESVKKFGEGDIQGGLQDAFGALLSATFARHVATSALKPAVAVAPKTLGQVLYEKTKQKNDGQSNEIQKGQGTDEVQGQERVLNENQKEPQVPTTAGVQPNAVPLGEQTAGTGQPAATLDVGNTGEPTGPGNQNLPLNATQEGQVSQGGVVEHPQAQEGGIPTEASGGDITKPVETAQKVTYKEAGFATPEDFRSAFEQDRVKPDEEFDGETEDEFAQRMRCEL